MQAGDFGLDECVADISFADHHFIEGPLLIVVRRKVQSGGRICLGISVYDEHFLLQYGQRRGQVYRGGSLADSTLLIGYCYYFSHVRFFKDIIPAKLQNLFHTSALIITFVDNFSDGESGVSTN